MRKVKKHIDIQKKDKLFVWSLYLLIGCISLFAVVLALRISKSPRTESPKNVVNTGEKIWMDYTNPEFQFSMDVPRLLTKRETRDREGYRYFMILGENQVSKGKGVSLGITDRSMDEEIAVLKKGYETDAKLESEKDIQVSGLSGKQLSFVPKGAASAQATDEPKEDKSLEKRDVVVFSQNGVTYMIATVPEQMGHIIESFRFKRS